MSVHYLSPRHRLRAVQFRPLAWPAAWPRTTAPRRQHAVVHLSALGYAPNRALSPTEAMAQLFRALETMCATTCIVFANVTPDAAGELATDPGAAARFELDGQEHVLACDHWDRPADNIAGIVAMLEMILRQGNGCFGARVQAMMRQATAAPSSLPASGAWHEVLGVPPGAPMQMAETAYRSRARQFHPDVGGTGHDMVRLNDAIAEARRIAIA